MSILYLIALPAESIEVTEHSNNGIFSSLSRNFDETLDKINGADKNFTAITNNNEN